MPGQELIPTATEVPSMLSKLVGESNQYYTSLPQESFNDKTIVQRAASTEDVKISDVKDGKWITRHLFASTVQLVNEESGEINLATRVAMISPDGKICSCVSEGAVNSIRQIVASFGRPPWEPPLTLVFESRKTRRGFRTYVVTVAPIEEKA